MKVTQGTVRTEGKKMGMPLGRAEQGSAQMSLGDLVFF